MCMFCVHVQRVLVTHRVVESAASPAASVRRPHPPLTKNQPIVAGSIKWSRALFARVKQTMAKLFSVEGEMMALELGQEVNQKYLALARHVMIFEKDLYKSWVGTIDSAALSYLKLNILTHKAESNEVVVNFSDGLVRLMRETRYLDRMGFDIPEVALNITLQEGSYIKCAAQPSAHLEGVWAWRCTEHVIGWCSDATHECSPSVQQAPGLLHAWWQ
jgi:Dynein heavy chain, N-terminal region 1